MELELTTSFTAPTSTFGNPVWWMLGSSAALAWIVLILLAIFLPRIVRDFPLSVVWYLGSLISLLILALGLTYGPTVFPSFAFGIFLSAATVWNFIYFSGAGDRKSLFFGAKLAAAWCFMLMAQAFWAEVAFNHLNRSLSFVSGLWWAVSLSGAVALILWMIGVVRLVFNKIHQLQSRLKGKSQTIRITHKDWPQSR